MATKKNRPPRLPNGTPVHVRSHHFAEECNGVVTMGEYDGGWLYRVRPTSGTPSAAARNKEGEYWFWDSEVRPVHAHADELVAEADACPKCRERNVDNLVWQKSGKVKCSTCGMRYTPPTK
jgi:hypothetical protein